MIQAHSRSPIVLLTLLIANFMVVSFCTSLRYQRDKQARCHRKRRFWPCFWGDGGENERFRTVSTVQVFARWEVSKERQSGGGVIGRGHDRMAMGLQRVDLAALARVDRSSTVEGMAAAISAAAAGSLVCAGLETIGERALAIHAAPELAGSAAPFASRKSGAAAERRRQGGCRARLLGASARHPRGG